MRSGILGIDFGTSSIKVLLWKPDGSIQKARSAYEGVGCSYWVKALKEALRSLDVSDVAAIGLSSQVGTYVVDDKEILSWNTPAGKEELAVLKQEYTREQFIKEISMPHPDIASYPLPRLLYIQKAFAGFQKVCQPKDYLCEVLTGNRVTDVYSWRGLANLETGKYSSWGLSVAGVSEHQLPRMLWPTEVAGELISDEFGILKGTPVYVGCNDFFAGLLGMGIQNQVFDISGTSEHVGVVKAEPDFHTKMVSGPYFHDYVQYGVTASSGVSMDFCLKHFVPEVDIESCLRKNPPIFLPYLNGERAPIFNPEASGVFFGIHGNCDKDEMAYAVMEGIVFSLYHIYRELHADSADIMVVAGGAAKNKTLNQLKAELFGLTVKTLQENDTSALGATMLAAVGHGVFDSLETAAQSICKEDTTTEPCGKYREVLLERFELYKKLYPSVAPLFEEKKHMMD